MHSVDAQLHIEWTKLFNSVDKRYPSTEDQGPKTQNLVEKKYVSYFLAMARRNPNHGSASLALEQMLNSSVRQQLDLILPQSLEMQQTNRLHVMSFNLFVPWSWFAKAYPAYASSKLCGFI